MATKKEKKRIANARRRQQKIDNPKYVEHRLSEPCREHNDISCLKWDCHMIDQKKIWGDRTQFYESNGNSIELTTDDNGNIYPPQ